VHRGAPEPTFPGIGDMERDVGDKVGDTGRDVGDTVEASVEQTDTEVHRRKKHPLSRRRRYGT
jgi:hypothetical protein